MIVQPPERFTAREYEEIKIQQEENDKSRQFQLDLAKIENSYWVLLRIPIAIISLPVKFVLAIALCVTYAKGKEPSKDFWKALNF